MDGQKPIGSPENPRRVHVLSKDFELKGGETYEGWHCRSCGSLIAIDRTWPEAVRIPDTHFVLVVCPQCKTDRVGTWAGRQPIVHARR
jgi:hypothetical protein